MPCRAVPIAVQWLMNDVLCCVALSFCANSPELSELHNQAALLLLFGHQHDAAAKHAADALEITQKVFGTVHPLTGHRLLRLGTIRLVKSRAQ